MTFIADSPRTRVQGTYPLETMRALAVVLLVSYHVIGSGPGGGLHLDYPHMGRFFADALVDLRMPLFAFIAGHVYAMRPILPGQYWNFLKGKFHRLYIPGVVAALAFATMTLLLVPSNALKVSTLWTLFILPYAHYWFLQAILLIFIVYGACDMALRQRGTLVIFVLSIVAFFFGPRPAVNLMSYNQALYLLPYFLLGVLFLRHKPWIDARAGWFVAVAITAVAAGAWWNLEIFAQTGRLSTSHRDLQSLGTGLALCAFCVLTLPRFRTGELIGPFAFTIYLYHVFGTAGMREALHALGITDVVIVFTASLIAGLAVPVSLHILAARYALTRRFVLGRA